MPRHHDDVDTRIEAQNAVEKVVPERPGVAQIRQQQPAAPIAHAVQRFVGVGRSNRLVSEIVDEGRKCVELLEILIENARR